MLQNDTSPPAPPNPFMAPPPERAFKIKIYKALQEPVGPKWMP